MKATMYTILAHTIGAPLILTGQALAATGRGVQTVGEKIENAGIRVEAEGMIQFAGYSSLAEQAGAEKAQARIEAKKIRIAQVAAAEVVILERMSAKIAKKADHVEQQLHAVDAEQVPAMA